MGRVVCQGFLGSPDGWDFPDPVIRAFAGYGTARPPVQMGMGANVLVHMHLGLTGIIPTGLFNIGILAGC